MRTQKSREGYLLVDHQFSPGLPEDVARKAGYDSALCKEGKRFEVATLTCSHCQAAVVKNHWRVRERGYCWKCNHYVCDACAMAMQAADYDHLPFEKLVDVGLKHVVQTGQPLGSPQKLLLK